MTPPDFQVGDRVERTAAHQTGWLIVPPGTLGTVETVEATRVFVQWDDGACLRYVWPADAARLRPLPRDHAAAIAHLLGG